MATAKEIGEIPAFRTELSAGGTMQTFWCPWCRMNHTHGAEAGHRSAHCETGPFRESGYFLLPPGESAPKRHSYQERRQQLTAGCHS